MIDNVLVHGKTQQKHDHRLMAVLNRLCKAKVTLNKEKCKYSKYSITFLGQIIDQSGIRPDLDKVKAIQDMQEPQNITELRRFPKHFEENEKLRLHSEWLTTVHLQLCREQQ